MSTFNAAFCLAGFSTQRSNIKAAHGPGKLGFAGAGGGVLIIDSEYAGFIAVEDHRFTVFLDIATCSFKIGKCGLRFHKQQVHQATGGIVNIDQGRTGSPPVFKPVVVAAINLYQLASTRTPVTRLMNFRCALSAGNPESGLYHETSDGFLSKDQTVNFLQLFPR
uniref:Orf4 n=1 Tax=Escherichia coli TaxID=562 RepID=A0A0K2B6G4_ECOLX|nr:orf4 [Escherichia coli]